MNGFFVAAKDNLGIILAIFLAIAGILEYMFKPIRSFRVARQKRLDRKAAEDMVDLRKTVVDITNKLIEDKQLAWENRIDDKVDDIQQGIALTLRDNQVVLNKEVTSAISNYSNDLQEVKLAMVETKLVLQQQDRRVEEMENAILGDTIDLKNYFGLDRRSTEPIRVVCIEDNDNDAKLMELMVKRGRRPTILFTQAVSIEDPDKLRGDVILLNPKLRSHQGGEIVGDLLSIIKTHTPVIIVSDDVKAIEAGMRAGATGSISKDVIGLDGELEREIAVAMIKAKQNRPERTRRVVVEVEK